ncbi:MAG: serine/threonine-protein kinase [Myxococcota bacterium]|nr:serine/threonine-protein kinase [Myxococcota bacterium]
MIDTNPDGRQCRVCNAQVPKNNSFCGECGARITADGGRDQDILVGQVVDQRYRVEQCIATGGMGAVYRAEHVGLGKVVAIKFLRGDLRHHPHLAKRLRREAMAVSKLTDQHTISVFDFGVWRGLAFLVMEYLEGNDLASVLAKRPRLPESTVVMIARQICQSLAEAHQAGVVHRDLKPENIFLVKTKTGAEVVKVLDFGLAKLVDIDGTDGRFHTQDGAILGTPYYMAPEQSKGGTVDARTDLYALGAVMFRMLSGVLPYTGRSPADIFRKQQDGELPRFADLDPAFICSPELEILVRQLMANEPKDRPASALDICHQLTGFNDPLLPSSDSSIGSTTEQNLVQSSPADGNSDTEASLFELGEPARADSGPNWAASETGSEPSNDAWSLGAWDVMKKNDSRAIETDFFAPIDSDSFSSDDDFLFGEESDAYETKLRRRRFLKVVFLFSVFCVLVAAGTWYRTELGTRPLTYEQEPNDSSATATRIALSTAIKGVLGFRADRTKSDQDLYRLDGPFENAIFEVQLSGIPNMDVVVDVISFDGTPLKSINRNGIGGMETDTVRVDKARGVQFRVRELWTQSEAPKENTTDEYSLLVTRVLNTRPSSRRE